MQQLLRTVREEKGKRESVERGLEERKSQRRESKKKEDQSARKSRKVAKNCVFNVFPNA
jgi:hypothetical protein